MFKIVREHDDLQKTLIFSLILHAIIFIILIRNSSNKHAEISSKNNTQTVINPMMVKLNPIQETLNYKKRKINIEKTENDSEKCIKKEPLEKKIAEQKYQEYTNKEQLQIQEEERIKMKNKEEPEKGIVKVKSQSKKIDNLQKEDVKVNISNPFRYFSSDKNTSRDVNRERKGELSPLRERRNNSRRFSNSINIDDINIYARKIKEAIEGCFYDFSSYAGQVCRLRLKISPDGVLLDVKSEQGDHALCTMALTAARQAKFPRPPSREVYDIFKNTSLDFKP